MSRNIHFAHNNLNKAERQALKRLSKNSDITIKPADKGGATVILNSIDYYNEAKRQLINKITVENLRSIKQKSFRLNQSMYRYTSQK